MAWPKEHKEKVNTRILQSASALFATNGFKKVTIDQIMQHAGLTRGIFYSYFKSKAHLYQRCIGYAATNTRDEISKGKKLNLKQVAHAYIEHNLDSEKRIKCPVAFLANDIGSQNQEIKDSYSKVLEQFVKNIKSTGLNNEQAMQNAIMMIGTVVIAGAVDDEKLKKKIVKAAKAGF